MPPVEPRSLLDALLDFAARLPLEVRREPFSHRSTVAGGLCRLRGREVILLDAAAPAVEQAVALAEALALKLEARPLPACVPVVKEALQAAQARLSWRGAGRAAPPAPARRTTAIERRVSTLRRPKPGLRSTRPRNK